MPRHPKSQDTEALYQDSPRPGWHGPIQIYYLKYCYGLLVRVMGPLHWVQQLPTRTLSFGPLGLLRARSRRGGAMMSSGREDFFCCARENCPASFCCHSQSPLSRTCSVVSLKWDYLDEWVVPIYLPRHMHVLVVA